MKKRVFVISIGIVMLIISRFLIRIIDATVQIGVDDVIVLVIFLMIVNFIIGLIGWKIYKMTCSR